MNRKTGFVPEPITEDHFTRTGVTLGGGVLKADGDWFKYLPVPESQLEKDFDTYGCTVYATLNAIETLEKFLTGNESNYSERFIYNVVEITPPGSDPHKVATYIRGSGLVKEEDLPDEVASLNEFMTPRPVPVELRVKGAQWKWQLGHEWVITPDTPKNQILNILKEELLKGTLCISVSAWYQNPDGLYYSPMGQDNEHWTMCYNIDSEAIYVFDQYFPFLKKLTLDHKIEYAKRYSLTLKGKGNWLVDLFNSFINLFK